MQYLHSLIFCHKYLLYVRKIVRKDLFPEIIETILYINIRGAFRICKLPTLLHLDNFITHISLLDLGRKCY